MERFRKVKEFSIFLTGAIDGLPDEDGGDQIQRFQQSFKRKKLGQTGTNAIKLFLQLVMALNIHLGMIVPKSWIFARLYLNHSKIEP